MIKPVCAFLFLFICLNEAIEFLPPKCENLTQTSITFSDGKLIRIDWPHKNHRKQYDCFNVNPMSWIIQPVKGISNVIIWSDNVVNLELRPACECDKNCCQDESIVTKGKGGGKNLIQIPNVLAMSGISIFAGCCSHVTVLPGMRNLKLYAIRGSTIKASAENTTFVEVEHQADVILHDNGLVGAVSAYSGGYVQVKGIVEKVSVGYGSTNNGLGGRIFVQGSVKKSGTEFDELILRINGDERACDTVTPMDGYSKMPTCTNEKLVVPNLTESGCFDTEGFCANSGSRNGSKIWLWPLIFIYFFCYFIA
mmetsp:Transcript_25795/g.29497  ORF Transcript_25795/g.29497 Transcript_25795/m.29497 type:complete len:309 (+) Transcript_25795:33-959(+)